MNAATNNYCRNCKVRTLKVYEKMQPRYNANGYPVLFPEIRLMGRWLEENGFKAGQFIEITYQKNRITITHAWTERPDKNKKHP